MDSSTARWTARGGELLWVLCGAAVFAGGSVELQRYFGRRAPLAGDLALSVYWLAYAGALVRLGFQLDRKDVRSAGLAVAAGAGLKIVLYDLSNLDALYRIASFFAFALIALPLGLERRHVSDDAAAGVGALPHADRQDVPGNAEVLDRPGEGEGIRRHDAHVARELDERFRIETLGVHHRRERVGEDLELGRDAHVVSVRRNAIRNDARTCLVFRKRLDHAALSRHPADPAVGLDGHRAAIYRRHRHLRHSIRLTSPPWSDTFRRVK